MISDARFQILEKIFESNRSVLYRATSKVENKNVILKTFPNNFPTKSEIEKLKQEYQLLNRLKSDKIIEVIELSEKDGKPCIIMEDFGGESLDTILMRKKFDLSEVLENSIKIAKILEFLYQNRLIHKDINPSNILVNEKTGQVKLIDFGIAVEHKQLKLKDDEFGFVEGTLTYIAPEQTDRINKTIDYRSDYYSFGITLYEMLVGVPPFKTKDTLELIHSHIAVTPVSPTDIDRIIPKTVSEIVLKLISKSAEDRYQSMFGFIYDIQKCIDLLNTSGTILPFEIGKKDYSDRFNISKKIEGREDELKFILDTYEKVLDGKKEIVVFYGEEGIGKTGLINEVFKKITQINGDFISCSFEHEKEDRPYEQLSLAFEQIIYKILTLSDSEIEIWKSKFDEALYPNGQIVIDFIPSFEAIIGKQPEVEELDPEQTQNRILIVFQEFVKVLLDNGLPLVLFIDDLHFADAATLNLISVLLTNNQINNILFLGSYRSGEVSKISVLQEMFKKLHQKEVSINEVGLTPLKYESIIQIIIDTIGCNSNEAELLARIALEKTNGNPYYINEFLTFLFEEQLINFDRDRKKWVWDISKIRSVSASKNVINLLSEKINNLDKESKDLLKKAACIGKLFNLKNLSNVCDQSHSDIEIIIEKLIDEGLILQYHEGISEDRDNKEKYSFVSERIRKNAYKLLTDIERKTLHLEICRKLYSKDNSDLLDNRLYEIIYHASKSLDLLGEKEKPKIAELFLKAGYADKKAAVYEKAYNNFKIGINLLSQKDWDENYNLILKLHQEFAESAYLIHNYKECEEFADIVKDNTKTVLDKVRITEILIQSNITELKRAKAIEIALEMFSELGYPIEENPSQLKVLFEILKTKQKLSSKDVLMLESLPEMKDPKILAFMQIYLKISPALYFENQNLSAFLICKAINFSLKFGNTIASIYAYLSFGIVLCTELGDYKSNIKYGETAISLLNKINTKQYGLRISLLYNAFVHHWNKNPQSNLKELHQIYKSGIDKGDIEFSEYSVQIKLVTSFYTGIELNKLEAETRSYIEEMAFYFDERAVVENNIYRQGMLNLLEEVPDPLLLTGNAFNEKKFLETPNQEKLLLTSFYLVKAILAYLNEKYFEANKMLDKAEQHKKVIAGQFHQPILSFYNALIKCQVYAMSGTDKPKKVLKSLKKELKYLKKIALLNPVTYENKYFLVKAELSRILGNTNDALNLYQLAIQKAKENNFVNEEAISNELCAKLYKSINRKKLAEYFILESYNCYTKWGAKLKQSQLEKEYPHLFLVNSYKGKPTYTTTKKTSEEQLDFLSLLKAARSISGEIVKEKLFENLVKIIAENAGAQKATLLLKDEGHLTIEARSDSLQSDVIVETIDLDSDDNKTNQLLPVSIVKFVSRTQKEVVLENASKDGIFTSDPYVVKNKLKSVLCFPITQQNKTIGIIYLENKLNTGMFTDHSLEVFNILSAQAAVSIENAKLFAVLEDKVKKRTQDLRVVNDTLEKELNEAAKYIDTLLPTKENESFNLDWHFYPSAYLGGDSLGYQWLDEDNFAVYIIDVSGHGVGSTLLSVSVLNTLNSRLLPNIDMFSPTSVLNGLNKHFTMEKHDNKFFTICYGIINKKTNVFRYALGGHPPPIIVNKMSGEIEYTSEETFMVGALPDTEFPIHQKQLNNNDKVYFISDGVFSNSNLAGDVLGFNGFLKIVKTNAFNNNSLDYIFEDIKYHCGNLFEDDYTLIELEIDSSKNNMDIRL